MEKIREHVAQWCETHAPGLARACPICGGQAAWGPSDKMYVLLATGDDMYVIPMVCERCGYTVLWNARVVGVLQFIERTTDHEKEETALLSD